MRHPAILAEIERRRKVPSVKEFVEETTGDLNPEFVLANTLQLIEEAKLLGAGADRIDRLARLLELVQRELKSKGASSEEKPQSKFAALSADELSKQLADRMGELETIEAELAARTPEEVASDQLHKELVARVAELKLALAQPAQVVPPPSNERDPAAPWRQASPPPWRPPKPVSEPNLGRGTMCLNDQAHAPYLGKQCPACQEFWRAEAAREARSWNRRLIPALWG